MQKYFLLSAEFEPVTSCVLGGHLFKPHKKSKYFCVRSSYRYSKSFCVILASRYQEKIITMIQQFTFCNFWQGRKFEKVESQRNYCNIFYSNGLGLVFRNLSDETELQIFLIYRYEEELSKPTSRGNFFFVLWKHCSGLCQGEGVSYFVKTLFYH